MQCVRRKYPERREDDACKGQEACDPRKSDYAGDDGGRRQHDTDLEGSGRQFEVMILRRRKVAFFFRVLGAFGELFGFTVSGHPLELGHVNTN